MFSKSEFMLQIKNCFFFIYISLKKLIYLYFYIILKIKYYLKKNN